jgi:orotidine-5'-phosphate decarboxylase
MDFLQKFTGASNRNASIVCVGLDPDLERIPDHVKSAPDPLFAFLNEIVAATRDLVCCYKPNFAFFGSSGRSGWESLEALTRIIPEDIPILLDFKAGDIGNTAAHYARMAYERIQADAVTVNPLMGLDAVDPFLSYRDKCCFLLCLTSNPGSSDFQRLETNDGPLYQAVAKKAVTWSSTGPCGLVVGATHPKELSEIRGIAPTLPFLVPGVGSQGGSAEEVVKNGRDETGAGLLINASRSILYASSGKDFAEAARSATIELRDQLAAAPA